MKNIKIYTGIIIFILSGILFTSCEQQNSSFNNEAFNNELEIASTQAYLDDISEGIDDIIDNVSIDFTSDDLNKIDLSKTANNDFFLSDCLIITKEFTRTSKKITLDYGDGCTTKNENVIRGKIIIAVSFNFDEKSIQLHYTFDDFYFNDKKIEGNVQKYKLRVNEKGNPEVTINRDLKIIWEDGSFVKVKGDRIREWIEGVRNGNWADNVFLITGSWTFTKKDGSERIATIIEPLKRNMACRFLVSGILEIKKNDKIIVLDYGDGTCDNLATAIINDVAHEFILKKRRKN